MIRPARVRPSGLLALLLLAALASCLKPAPSPPVVFHTLSPLPPPAPPVAGRGPAVEVMPVRLPDLLRRPQMLLPRGAGGLGLSDTHRWGNPLDQDVQRVLVENLALLLGSDAVVASPYGDRVQARFRLELEVTRWDARDGGGLVLKALWMVSPSAGGPAVLVRRTELREPWSGTDPETLATAHSRVLGILSQEIAAALRELDVRRP